MGTINDKLTYLNGTKTAIKNAIIAKGVSISENDTFRSYASKIGNIETSENLSTELNAQDTALSNQETIIGQIESTLNNKIALDLQAATSDANATANDIAKNKTAYVNGVKLTGTSEGGASYPPNWSLLGLETTPPDILSDFEYSRYIQNNFVPRTNITEMFMDDTQLKYAPTLDFTNVEIIINLFARCSNLISVGNLDFSRINDLSGVFAQCTHLITVPVFNASSCFMFDNMFFNCPTLSNDSLNNILAMCITGTTAFEKTLSNLGLTQAQATICQTLSNWNAFVAAGWSTGY